MSSRSDSNAARVDEPTATPVIPVPGSPTASADARPPNQPWRILAAATPPGGFLSFYYSDPASPLPVRAITRFVGKRFDNKSDPNVETLTYGLFSTCEVSMRASVVSLRAPYLVFVTTVGTKRCLTGYFRIGWWAPGPVMPAYGSSRRRSSDVMLAAAEARFVHPGIPLEEAAATLSDPSLAGWFRTYKRLSPGQVEAVVGLLRSRPDVTPALVDEVYRLERLNERFSGFKYPGWRREKSFDWEEAKKYLPSGESNPSPSGATAPVGGAMKYWTCLNCGRQVDNVAPLKRCPWCGELGTLSATGRPDP